VRYVLKGYRPKSNRQLEYWGGHQELKYRAVKRDEAATA
jgi:hypothetical protein